MPTPYKYEWINKVHKDYKTQNKATHSKLKPMVVHNMPTLSSSAKTLASALCLEANDSGYCYPNNDRLVEMGITRNARETGVEELVAAGLIEKTYYQTKLGNRSCGYQLILGECSTEHKAKCSTEHSAECSTEHNTSLTTSLISSLKDNRGIEEGISLEDTDYDPGF